MADSQDTKTSSIRPKLGLAVALSTASGLLTLIDPAKLRPVTRASLCLGTGVATGAFTWFGTSHEEPVKSNLKLRTAFALGLTVLGVASTKLSFVADRKIHQSLLKRGVANPRAVMAVGSGLLTLLTFLVDPPREEEHDSSVDGSEDELPIRELSPEVLGLIEGMLAGTEDFGAAILREQLAGAREQYWGDGEGFGYQLDLVVPAEAERSVPRNFTFPVHADFTTSAGQPVRISLAVHDGHLGALLLDVNHERMETAAGNAEDPLESVTAWPLRSEVNYSFEGSNNQ